MEAITLQSVTSPKDFRFAVYFDCFAQHRFQSLFVGVAAVASYVLLSLHFLGFLALSNIILLCCAAVGASIPLMIFSCEQQCFNYAHSERPQITRIVKFDDRCIRLSCADHRGYEKIEWRLVLSAFELKKYFIIYIDKGKFVLFNKTALNDNDQALLQGFLRDNLGKSFRNRCS